MVLNLSFLFLGVLCTFGKSPITKKFNHEIVLSVRDFLTLFYMHWEDNIARNDQG